jgi:hypothetical protein
MGRSPLDLMWFGIRISLSSFKVERVHHLPRTARVGVPSISALQYHLFIISLSSQDITIELILTRAWAKFAAKSALYRMFARIVKTSSPWKQLTWEQAASSHDRSP